MRRSISSMEDSLSASRSTSSCAPPASAPGGPDAAPPPCDRGLDVPPDEFGCFLALGGRMKSSGCSKTCLLDRRPPCQSFAAAAAAAAAASNKQHSTIRTSSGRRAAGSGHTEAGCTQPAYLPLFYNPRLHPTRSAVGGRLRPHLHLHLHPPAGLHRRMSPRYPTAPAAQGASERGRGHRQHVL